MAFFSMILAAGFILLAAAAFIVAFVVFAVGIITLIVSKRKEKTGGKQRVYPLVLIAVGLVVMLPIAGITGLTIGGWKIESALSEQQTKKSLYSCLIHRRFDDAKALLERGASPDCGAESNEPAADDEYTLLMKFSSGEYWGKSSADIVAFLVENGADVNRRMFLHDKDDERHFGEDTDRTWRKYNFDRTDDCGATPLLLALQYGDVEVVKLLIDAGADVHAVDYNGKNAFMYAAGSYNGTQRELIKLLDECGVDRDAKDNFGQTAKDYWLHYHDSIEF